MSINSETAHLHQSNSQLLLSRTRLVIQSMINLDSCYKEKFMVTCNGLTKNPNLKKKKKQTFFLGGGGGGLE